MDEEQKLGGSAECLSASAFLARYGSFGYIETGPGMKMSERATSKIKSPNSVIRTRSNSMKINAGDILKSPKNQEMDSRFFARFLLTPTDVTLFVACSSHSLALTKEGPLATRHSLVLTGSAPPTEIDVTCSKQTTEKFLTGARTHIKETRICAKMAAQISSKLSAQMS